MAYPRRIAVSLVAFLLLSLADSSGAENLVRNGTFDTDISQWTVEAPDAQAAWYGADASGYSSSGSVLVSNVSTGPSNGAGISQCITTPALVAGAAYTYGGRALILSGQERTGPAMLGLRWYTTPDCSGQSEDQPRLITRAVGSWISLSETSVAPAGTRSVEFVAFPSKVDAGGILRVAFDNLVLSLSPNVVTIPASASIHGVAGAFFHSDLWVMNLSATTAATATGRLRCLTGFTCDATPRTIVLAPRASALFSDAVGTLFASPEAAGAIELSFDPSLAAIAATSRVYTPSLPAPTFGASIPGLRSDQALAQALFLGLGSNGGNTQGGFRANVGAYNPHAASVTVSFALYQADGAQLGSTLTRAWNPNEAYQINDVFAAVGAGATVTTNAYLVVTAAAPIFPYVTVIDNLSGDTAWVIPQEETQTP